jgi:putative transposase
MHQNTRFYKFQIYFFICISRMQHCPSFIQCKMELAKGDIFKPGKNVKSKSGLNKSILDQGWGMFVQMLEYKQAWSGGDVLRVNPKNTSRTCPCCGHVAKENRITQANFECVECGFKANADLVGALNVLERGHRLLACGESSLECSVKQEPVTAESLVA